jgi:hypothetical protein
MRISDIIVSVAVECLCAHIQLPLRLDFCVHHNVIEYEFFVERWAGCSVHRGCSTAIASEFFRALLITAVAIEFLCAPLIVQLPLRLNFCVDRYVIAYEFFI